MSTATCTICDQCKGVIPAGAPHIRGVSATLVLETGEQDYPDLDFCCTSHMAAYIGTQPPVADPQAPYQPIPSQ